MAMRKNEIWPFVATWMELESIMLSEISHTEKVRCHVFILRWILRNLKKTMGQGKGNKFTEGEGGKP